VGDLDAPGVLDEAEHRLLVLPADPAHLQLAHVDCPPRAWYPWVRP
jgi:hypothetical protein